jgi:hypothetical protein
MTCFEPQDKFDSHDPLWFLETVPAYFQRNFSQWQTEFARRAEIVDANLKRVFRSNISGFAPGKRGK